MSTLEPRWLFRPRPTASGASVAIGDCAARGFYSLHEAMKKKMFVGVSALMTPGRPIAGSP